MTDNSATEEQGARALEKRIHARKCSNTLLELGISLAAEEGLTDPELNRHFWRTVRDLISELLGEDELPVVDPQMIRPPLEMDVEVPPDDEPFPFGKHKDEPYGEVPDSYYGWLSRQDWIEKWPEVLAYIQEHDLDT